MRTIAPLVLVALVACRGADYDTTTVTAANLGPSDSRTTFQHYRTFSMGPLEGPPAGYEAVVGDAQTNRRLQGLVATALRQRGYVQVPDKGDFVVRLGAGHREVTINEESNISPGWQAPDATADFVESALALDATDGSKGDNVWHAETVTRLDTSDADDHELMHVIDSLLAQFPRSTH